MPLISAGIGAGVGLLQNQANAPQRAKQRQLAAATAAYSPWTGMKPDQAAMGAQPTGLSGAMQGGMAGAAFGQGLQQSNNANDLMKAQMKMYQANTPQAPGVPQP